MLEAVVQPIAGVQGENDGETGVWVEALPARVYSTDRYGDVPITPQHLTNLVGNFKNNVRGQDISIDFEHGVDRAKGNKASGWYKDVKIAPSTADPNVPALWGLIEFTEEAKREIADNQWKYFSLEWEDEWVNNDGVKFTDVITGGGLTNRPIAKNTLPINFSETMLEGLDEEQKEEVLELAGESKELEHSDPGTGSPPAPRTDEDGSDDAAIRGGWRRETPPIAEPENHITVDIPKGGNKDMPVFELAEKDAHELIRALDLPVDADGTQLVEAAKLKFGELSELKQKESAVDQEKEFAEKYPQYWGEHRKLTEKMRETDARQFSESVSKIYKSEGYGLKDTKQQLSPQAQEKVAGMHKMFSEGTATIEDFEECIKAITSGGIIQFGELGSSGDDESLPEIDTTTAPGVAAGRKLFAEVVDKIQAEHEDWEYGKCLDEAARRHPDLAENYRVALPA